MGATGGEHSICDADVLKSTSFCCRLARMDQAVDAVFPWYASPGGRGGGGLLRGKKDKDDRRKS